MKKYCLCFALLAVFLVSCQANQPSTTSTRAEVNTTEKESTGMNLTVGNKESSPGIIWVEEGEVPAFDETGTRTIGIYFEKVDLSQPAWNGQAWDERGYTFEPRSNLAPILGRSISSRDEAAHVANEILASEQKNGAVFGGEKLELMIVRHDSDKNIWIFVYFINNLNDGSCFLVAVDGESGELLRMWIEG